MADDPTIPPVPGEGSGTPEPVQAAPETPPEPVVGEPTGEPAQEGEPEPGSDMHKMQSWIGRREAKLKQEFEQRLAQERQQIFQSIQPLVQQVQPVQPAPQQGVEFNYDNPAETMERYLQQREAAQNQYRQQMAGGINYIVMNDPVLREDPELQQEVIKTAYAINFDTKMDALANARLLAAEAKSAVLGTKIAESRKKSNPLAANVAKTQMQGGIAPTTTAQKKARFDTSKLDSEAQAAAQRWGYNEEELARLFGE